MSPSVAALIAEHDLPADYATLVERWWQPLARDIAAWRAAAPAPLVVGINGAQGSGKSTLAAFLERALLPALGLSAVTLSLDDLYLPRADRLALARDVHPLFATRGVPGTHDAALGCTLIDALRVPGHAPVRIPRFSKADDDRLPESAWRNVTARPDILLLEGWCVGARPEPPDALLPPVNALEAEEDAEGIWRGHVNAMLGGSYAALFARIERLVMLRPPNFEAVFANRLLQERKLREGAGGADRVMSDAAVERFVRHYERLTRHMFADLPQRADRLFLLDAQQRVISAR